MDSTASTSAMPVSSAGAAAAALPLPSIPFHSGAGAGGPIPFPPPGLVPEVKQEGGAVKVEPVVEEEEEEPEEEIPMAPNANETVYVRNLNEKVRLPILKETLTNLFSLYGEVLSVTAHANLRMRGQAFVALDSKKAANKAVKEVQGFPLYGRPMQMGFAKTTSDSILKRQLKEEKGLGDEKAAEEQEEFLAHKKQRLEHKEATRVEVRKRAQERKMAEKRAAAGETDGVPVPSSTAQRRQQVQMPDEYVPPNKILFLQSIASGVGKDELEALFAPLPNLVEVRTIPGRSDIAFVEFGDVPSSAAAREKLNGHAFAGADAGTKLKITYARA
ncbi:hypothetical protein OC834_000720 [Tilletia horrida]|nr:hypothetical protein OC834_000720 [Tilletia horrida]